MKVLCGNMIKDTGPTLPRIDGYVVAQALGAEPIDALELARNNWHINAKKRAAIMEWALSLCPDEDAPTPPTEGDE